MKTKTRICCAHFASNDIERNLQFEMGLCPKNGYKLKPRTIPTLDPKADTVSVSSRSNRMQVRAKQEMIACLLQQIPAPAEATATHGAEKNMKLMKKRTAIAMTFLWRIRFLQKL